jgi:hypothetical protein
MQPTNIFIRRLAPTVVLALVALAAFGAGAAGAAGVSDGKAAVQAEEFVPGVTDFPSRVVEIGGGSGAIVRAEGFTPGVTDFPSRLGAIGEQAAEARLAQLSQQPAPVKVDESGFDWGAGATGAIAATLLLLGAALAVRTARRSRVALG